MIVKLKRVYDAPALGDGCRILVDRIWPRGVSRQAASISLWLKTIAPSTELRKWYGHSPDRWPEFKRRYLQELSSKDNELGIVRDQIKKTRNVTLVYSAKDTSHNQAVVLLEYLSKSDPNLIEINGDARCR